MKINKKKGILFWITGLSGSGKTEIAKNIKKFVKKKYGPTIIVSGDDLREIFKINGYSKKKRLEFSNSKLKFYKLITDQGINLIFTTISLFNSVRKKNRKEITNYVEIYIKTDVNLIIKKNLKKLYQKKNEKIWGVNIIPDFPKNPNITIENNFQKTIKQLSNQLIRKLSKL